MEAETPISPLACGLLARWPGGANDGARGPRGQGGLVKVGPLLETKFHIPTRRGTRTSRPRLSNRAVEVARASLTLVSAPAGFGKTTLLTDWMESLPDGIARSWLSLDSQDNEPGQFWMYIVTAIRKAVGDDI